MRGDPIITSKPVLETLLRLCTPLRDIVLTHSDAAYKTPLPCAVKAGTYTLMCENTTKGPVINGVPDANVAYSAYVLDGETRIDLFGCGPTPEAAVDSLAQDALAQLGHVRRARQLDNLDEPMTPEMRERADAVVAEMRARWAAKDAETDKANRAFDIAFRKALRQPEDR